MTNKGMNRAENDPFRSNQPRTVYSVRAISEPGVMPRMMELLAKRGMVPDQWQSCRIGPKGDVLHVTFSAHDLETTIANHIANCLRQVVGVETVVMSRDETEEDQEDNIESALENTPRPLKRA